MGLGQSVDRSPRTLSLGRMLPNLPSHLRYLLPLSIASSIVKKIKIMTSFILLPVLRIWSAAVTYQSALLTLSMAPWALLGFSFTCAHYQLQPMGQLVRKA